MATYYVDGTNGNDAYDGTSPTFVSGSIGPKKTLTAMEAKPVAAGDLVHVRAGTYRETLTCGVSGTAGNPIEYRGDYAGAVWAGGGVVRITGSDNDQTATRNSCIAATSKNYRTFTGFAFNSYTMYGIALNACANVTITKCFFENGNLVNGRPVDCAGAGQANVTISNCVALGGDSGVMFTHTSTVNNTAHLVSNCIFVGAGRVGNGGVSIVRVGGITVRNCHILYCASGVRVITALAAGQTVTVNNCIVTGSNNTAVGATTLGELVEDYNMFYGNISDRSNVNTGGNSKSYPPLFDPRWFFQLVTAAAASQVVSPFDLASYSQLINLAGTSPTTTDLRGTSAIGGTREFGALEYDPSLKIQGGGGGAVSISPLRGRLGG